MPITRSTKETHITANCDIYGTGQAKISTGIGYFDHMLESFSKHSLIDIELECKGDLHVDDHHSVEDCGIVLGELFKEKFYPLKGVERFGNASIVMDEACVECDLDLCNRPFFVCDLQVSGKVGTFDCELAEEFFKAVAFNAGIALHIIQKRGKNQHHIIEAAFKAFAVALRRALTHNQRIHIPSTKGIL
ncbi:imidazoleglycerol-phosphate dehydratase [Helicobacter monodelphidis]|uniref:imidazoleglycerol-phosphate dehydratase HisB n=1 Tax=Helicobacter sp. 15-1451 TaxID=2004995 RepID=UPI000DCCAA1F|nr:imidazoleglycerol-phosphate dehydratase HisB [Helicobacter sp. 15-1451]RAX58968.1 imidazoleglycerol-phosphate dehydratase [Helicobacter sp. 15-1451]